MGAADKNAEPPERGWREVAELSALADGTLDAAHQAEVHARIADSVELSALYDRERRVVDLLRQAQETTRAPAALRARIDAERRRARKLRLRTSYGGALVVGLAALVITRCWSCRGGRRAPRRSVRRRRSRCADPRCPRQRRIRAIPTPSSYVASGRSTFPTGPRHSAGAALVSGSIASMGVWL
jgi:hypothetical protein